VCTMDLILKKDQRTCRGRRREMDREDAGERDGTGSCKKIMGGVKWGGGFCIEIGKC